MKNLSIILTGLLAFRVLGFSLHIFELYDSKNPPNAFGLGLINKQIAQLPIFYIILVVIYIAALSISIFLNFQKRYTTNNIFSGTMIVISWFILLLF
jgi:uncharacterized RDD family membrane protein YckC